MPACSAHSSLSLLVAAMLKNVDFSGKMNTTINGLGEDYTASMANQQTRDIDPRLN